MPNGDVSPNCALTICAEFCDEPFSLTTSYSPYSFQYTAQSSDPSTVATFSVTCSAAAYVALDNVTVIANGAQAAVSTRTITKFITETQLQTLQPSPIVQTQATTQLVPFTTTLVLTTTTTISGSNVVITTTVPTVIYSTLVLENTRTQLATETATTVAWSTSTIEVPNTRFLNFTISELSTTTTTSKSGQSERIKIWLIVRQQRLQTRSMSQQRKIGLPR